MFSKLSKLFQEFWATVTLVAVWPKLTEVPLLAVNFSLLVDRKPLDVQKRSKRTLVTWALRPTSGDSARLPDSAHARLTRSEAIRDCCKRLIADLVQHRPPMDAVIPPGCSLKASQNRPRRPRKKGPNTKTLLVWKMTHWLFAKKGNSLWLFTWLENPATTLKPWNSLVIFQPACLDCHSWSVLGTNCH